MGISVVALTKPLRGVLGEEHLALIQKRLVEILDGARPLVERNGRSDLEVVVAEIMEDKITIDFETTEGIELSPAAAALVNIGE